MGTPDYDNLWDYTKNSLHIEQEWKNTVGFVYCLIMEV